MRFSLHHQRPKKVAEIDAIWTSKAGKRMVEVRSARPLHHPVYVHLPRMREMLFGGCSARRDERDCVSSCRGGRKRNPVGQKDRGKTEQKRGLTVYVCH